METRIDKHDEIRMRMYQVYRNSDGYPEGVIPDLYDFFKLCVPETTPRKEGQYITGMIHMSQVISLIRANKLYLSYRDESVGKRYGDEEWLYEVDITGAKTPDEVLVRYSTDFPKNHAFENANWSEWYSLGALYKKISQNRK